MNQERFWKKKTIVTYILSVMIVLLHLSTFANYSEGKGIIQQINDVFYVVFKETIVRVAVPAFFLISGALFFRDYTNENYLRKLKHRIHSLAIPYLIWNTVWMIFNIVASYSFLSDYFVGRDKYALSVPNVLLGIFHYQGLPALWFIFDLMFFALLSPIINLLVSRKWLGTASIIALALLAQLGVLLPEQIFFDGTAIIYYTAGAFIGKHCQEWFSSKSTKREIYVAGAVCIVGMVYLYGAFCGWFPYPLICEVVLLSVMAVSLWRFLDPLTEKIKHVDCMNESFMVYVLHGNLNSIITKLFFLTLPKTPYFAIPNYILSAVFVLLLIRFICWFLKKYAMPVYRVVSGARSS